MHGLHTLAQGDPRSRRQGNLEAGLPIEIRVEDPVETMGMYAQRLGGRSDRGHDLPNPLSMEKGGDGDCDLVEVTLPELEEVGDATVGNDMISRAVHPP